MRAMAGGDTAFRSATTGVAPVRRAAAAMPCAAPRACAGGVTDSTTSATAITSSRSASSSRPSASRLVRSERPAVVATTRAPPERNAPPSPAPMCPGLTIPTVTMPDLKTPPLKPSPQLGHRWRTASLGWLREDIGRGKATIVQQHGDQDNAAYVRRVHDKGLQFDLRTMSRRRLLAAFGGAGALAIVGGTAACGSTTNTGTTSAGATATAGTSASAATGSATEVVSE